MYGNALRLSFAAIGGLILACHGRRVQLSNKKVYGHAFEQSEDVSDPTARTVLLESRPSSSWHVNPRWLERKVAMRHSPRQPPMIAKDPFALADDVAKNEVGQSKSLRWNWDDWVTRAADLQPIGSDIDGQLTDWAATKLVGEEAESAATKLIGEEAESAAVGTPFKEFVAGQAVVGTVRSVTESAVFVDIGAESDGVLHIEEMDGVADPRGIIADGDTIAGWIKTVDLQTRKLALTTFDPTTQDANGIRGRFEAGQNVIGTVTAITNSTVFADIGAWAEGRLDVAEIEKPSVFTSTNPVDMYSVGETIVGWIKEIGPEKDEIKLSTVPRAPRKLVEVPPLEDTTKAVRDPEKLNETSASVAPVDRAPLEKLKATDDVEELNETSASVAAVDRALPAELKAGQKFSGTVQGVFDDGVFVDIGAKNEDGAQVDGLLYEAECEGLAVAAEKLEVGDKIKGWIKGGWIKRSGKSRLLLTTRDPESNKTRIGDLEVGEEFTGIVEHSGHIGVFIDIGARVLGLLRPKDIDSQTKNLSQEFVAGSTVKGWIKAVDADKERVDLTSFDPKVNHTLNEPEKIAVEQEELEAGHDSEKLNGTSASVEPVDRTPVEELQAGQQFTGTIQGVMDDGIVVDLGAQVKGLLHSREIEGWMEKVSAGDAEIDLASIEKRVLGSKISGWIKDIDFDNGLIGLTTRNPESVSSKKKAPVKKVTVESRVSSKKKTPVKNLTVGQPFTGQVASKTKASAVVDIGASKVAFLPFIRATEEVAIGDQVSGWIHSITGGNVFLTQQGQRRALEDFEVGQEVNGTVNQIQDFGVFVDVGAPADGLISRRSEPNFTRVSKEIAVGSTVKCWITEIDSEKSRIELTMCDPGSVERPIKELKAGQAVVGTVESLHPSGRLVDIGASQSALLMTHDFQENKSYQIGDEVVGWIRTIELKRWKWLITCRERIPLEELEIGHEYNGTVTRVTNFGTFVDTGAQRDGLLPASKSGQRPKVGDKVRVFVLEVDLDKHELRLTDQFIESRKDSRERESKRKDSYLRSEDSSPSSDKVIDSEKGSGAAWQTAMFGSAPLIDKATDSEKDRIPLTDKAIESENSSISEKDTIPLTDKAIESENSSIPTSARKQIMDLTPIQQLKVGQALGVETQDEKLARLATTAVGKELRGTIVTIKDFGLFVDIGTSKPACLHVRDIEGYIPDVSAAFTVGRAITVWIKEIDTQSGLVWLTARNPHEKANDKKANDKKTPIEELKVGQEFTGYASNVMTYGVFVDFGAEKAGLLALDAMREPVRDATDKFQIGDEISGWIRRTELKKNNIYLTTREGLTPLKDLKEGEPFSGTVHSDRHPQGLYVDIGAERDGLLTRPDLPEGTTLDDYAAGDEIKGWIRSIERREDQFVLFLTCRDPSLVTRRDPEVSGSIPLARLEARQASLEASEAVSLEEGDPFLGEVVSIFKKKAVFIDFNLPELGMLHVPKNGMLHVAEMRAFTPDATALFKPGDKVSGWIRRSGYVSGNRNIDLTTTPSFPNRNISLVDFSCAHPAEFIIGKIVQARGLDAFVYLKEGVFGIIHRSHVRVNGEAPGSETDEILRVGDEVQVRVHRFVERGILLSMAPWDENELRYDGDAGPFTLDQFQEFYESPAMALRQWQAASLSIDEVKGDITLKKRGLENKGRVSEELKVGQEVIGTITGVADFGVFVDIGARRDGLLHVTSLTGRDADLEKLTVGQQVVCKIKSLSYTPLTITLEVAEPIAKPAAST